MIAKGRLHGVLNEGETYCFWDYNVKSVITLSNPLLAGGIILDPYK